MNEIITYKTFDNSVLANIILEKLKANGIECFLTDENTVTLNPLYNLALGGIKLKLFENDIEKANEILGEKTEMEYDAETSEEIICPNCGSGDVHYGPPTKKKYSLLMLIFSFLTLAYPLSTKKIYHCFKCGNEFPEEGQVKRD